MDGNLAKINYETAAFNRFLQTDTSPFLTYLFDLRSDKNIAQYHPTLVGKKLAAKNIEPLKVSPAGLDKLALIFPTYDTANNFVSDITLPKSLDQSGEWRAVIPDHALYKVGVIHDIPLELSIEEVYNGLEDDLKPHVAKLVRCKRKEGTPNLNSQSSESNPTVWVDDKSIKIYCRKNIPKNIPVYFYPARVSAYVLPIRQCQKCFRFGHVKANCKSESRCIRCGISHPEDPPACIAPISCANCTGPQLSNSEDCLFYQFNFKLNQTRATLGCNVKDAEFVVRARFKKQHGSDLSSLQRVKKITLSPQGEVESQHLAINPYRMPVLEVSSSKSNPISMQSSISYSTPLNRSLESNSSLSKTSLEPPKTDLSAISPIPKKKRLTSSCSTLQTKLISHF